MFCFEIVSSINDNEDDGTTEFRKCLQVLADRVGFLSRHKEELLDKNRKVEVANEQLKKELEEKKELVKTLYTKHQLEKQVTCYEVSLFCFIYKAASFKKLNMPNQSCWMFCRQTRKRFLLAV